MADDTLNDGVEVPAKVEGEEAQASRRGLLALFGVLGAATLAACGGEGSPEREKVQKAAAGYVLTGTVRLVETIGTSPNNGDLRNSAGGFKGDVVLAQGFWTANDGGGGIFVWDTGSVTDDGGTAIVPYTDAPNPSAVPPTLGATALGGWRRLYDGPLNVKWFGAKGHLNAGAPWDTNPIILAICACKSRMTPAPYNDPPATLYLPSGRYILTQALVVDFPLRITGDGSEQSFVYFRPEVDGQVCLTIHGDGFTGLYGCSVEDLQIVGDSARAQDAFLLQDLSKFVMRSVIVLIPTTPGALSRGLRIQGRQEGLIEHVYIQADRCISLEKCQLGQSTLNFTDHWTFHNISMLGADDNESLISVEPGSVLTNINFTGHQTWNGGYSGLYWQDSTTSSFTNLNFQNVRWEDSLDQANGQKLHGFMFYFNLVQPSYNLLIQNCSGGSYGAQGLHLRHAAYLNLINFRFISNPETSGLMEIDVDETCSWLVLNGAYFGDGVTSAGLTKRSFGKLVCLFSTGRQTSNGRTTFPYAVYNNWAQPELPSDTAALSLNPAYEPNYESAHVYDTFHWKRTFSGLANADYRPIPSAYYQGPGVVSMVVWFKNPGLPERVEGGTFLVASGPDWMPPVLLHGTSQMAAGGSGGPLPGKINLYALNSSTYRILNLTGETITKLVVSYN